MALAATLVGCQQAGQSGVTGDGGHGTGGAGGAGADGGSAGSGGFGGKPSDCVQGCIDDHPAGAKVFEQLLVCVFCEECFGTCDGAKYGCEVPAMPGACEDVGPCSDDDSIDTNDCTACAFASTCKDELETCAGDSDCVKFRQCIDPCP